MNGQMKMAFTYSRNRLSQLIVVVLLAVTAFTLTTTRVSAADDVTLNCKKDKSDAALDFSTLGLHISPSVPVGTVLYSGSVTVTFICALNNLQQYYEGLTAEVFFKRQAIAEGALGYGLTLYTGYAGDLSTEPASIATGHIVSTFAYTSGGTIGSYTTLSLTVPFEIVRTSSSMAASTLLPSYVNVFNVGSYVKGSDLKFYFTNIKQAIAVTDETCKVASDSNQTVTLGSYTASPTSGLGSAAGQSSEMTPFTINLNCEALLSGRFDVMMQFDGTAASGYSDAGVLALNAASTASGVGVQLLNESQQPLSLGSPFHVASYPLASALISVPLYARYYQIADTVTPGSADAVAQYTISYQ